MSADIDHATLAKTLEILPLGVNASDLHGSLIGCLCAGAQVTGDDWLGALQLDPDDSTIVRNEILQRLYQACRAQVNDSPAYIQPLLPARTAPLETRAAALVEWCRGFLGGFGLGGATRHRPLSDDASEILRDLGVVASSHFDVDDKADDVQALVDVIDFVGTACAALHREVASGERGPGLH
ncbi:MAG: UPF0149 family protein [Dokdonella sp.]